MGFCDLKMLFPLQGCHVAKLDHFSMTHDYPVAVKSMETLGCKFLANLSEHDGQVCSCRIPTDFFC